MSGFLFHPSLVSLCMFFSLLSLHRSAVFLLSHTQLSSKIAGCSLLFALLLTHNPFPISFLSFFSASAPSIITQSLFHLHGTLTLTQIRTTASQCTQTHRTHTQRYAHTRSYKFMCTHVIRQHQAPLGSMYLHFYGNSHHSLSYTQWMCFFSFIRSAQH